MPFICTIVVVEDIARTRKLYENLLGQKVTSDFGAYNVGFAGGLAFYQKRLYQDLVGSQAVGGPSRAFELYFEEDDLPALERQITAGGFRLVHATREEPWKQRVFRFLDEDDHVVCIAERMVNVSRRLYGEQKSIDEIAALTGLPTAEIREHLAGVPNPSEG